LKKTILAVFGVLLIMLSALSGCASGTAIAGWAGITFSDGNIFTVSSQGQLEVINVSDLAATWSIDIAEISGGGLGCGPSTLAVAVYGTPAVVGDRVYVAGYNGKIYVYDLSTKALVKEFVLDEENHQTIVGGPVVGGGFVYIVSTNGYIYALNADKLELEWKFKSGGKIWSTPTLVDGTIYFSSFDGNLYALDAAKGDLLWQASVGGAVVASPVISGDAIYAVSFDRGIYAFNRIDGSLKWRFPADGQDERPQRWFWATPVVFNGYLYAPCLDGKVYAVSTSSVTDVIVFDLRSPISSSPVVCAGKVVVATEDASMYTIEASTNKQELLAELRDKEKESSMIINSQLCSVGNKVYIHTLKPDRVYAYDFDDASWKYIALDTLVSASALPAGTVTVTEYNTTTVYIPTTVTVTQ